MKNKIITLLIVLVLCVGAYFAFTNIKQTPATSKNNTAISALDGKNSTFTIDGSPVTLVNGISEIQAVPGSASKIVTRYFGNDIKADLNGDGKQDIAFLVTQETGGSGIFYYVVAILNATSGPIGSQGLFIGDRIAPQTTEVTKGNVVVVNYADRNPGEPFSTQPSQGKSLYLLLDTKTMQFGEVVQNFEGEANPAMMTLSMQKWTWINTKYNNNKIVTPLSINKFTITFKNDKTFSATTDCNSVGGEYSVNDNKIIFSKMMSTLMYCQNSQESDFTKMLEQTQNYIFTSKGELILGLNFDSGSMTFK
jgi:heat shock protein HslJ